MKKFSLPLVLLTVTTVVLLILVCWLFFFTIPKIESSRDQAVTKLESQEKELSDHQYSGRLYQNAMIEANARLKIAETTIVDVLDGLSSDSQQEQRKAIDLLVEYKVQGPVIPVAN